MDSDYPLDELVSQDPNFPSIAYRAHKHAPIYIPWIHRSLVLGVGFDSSIASNSRSIESALLPSALASKPQVYSFNHTNNKNSYRQVSSVKTSTSYQHLEFNGTFSAGGSFLGASGRGEYMRNVFDNKDVWSESVIRQDRTNGLIATVSVEQSLSSGLIAYWKNYICQIRSFVRRRPVPPSQVA